MSVKCEYCDNDASKMACFYDGSPYHAVCDDHINARLNGAVDSYPLAGLDDRSPEESFIERGGDGIHNPARYNW